MGLDLEWDARYPDRATLRQEIGAVTDSFVDALFGVFPPDAIVGLYAKGSARKPWDSPIDYVPEISDVDFHVLFADDDPDARYFASVEDSLAVQKALEDGYARRVPTPIHVPRVQLVIANTLYRQPDFIHSVPHTVVTLHGRPHPAPRIDTAKSLRAARTNLLSHEAYVRDLGKHVVDKPGRHIWEILRPMNWRIAPTGPRVLELRGVPFLDAWGANRTAIVRMLRDCGELDLAENYATFYLRGWDYFLSGRRDGEAARTAILAGVRVLSRSTALAGSRIGSLES